MLRQKWHNGSMFSLLCLIAFLQQAVFGYPRTSSKDIVRNVNDILDPVIDSSDPSWLKIMNYTRFVIDMDNALGTKNAEEWIQYVSQMIESDVKKNIATYEIDPKTCSICKFAINMIRNMIKSGKSIEQIIDYMEKACVVLENQTQRYCHGMMRLTGLDIIEVFTESPMTSTQICGFLYQGACKNSYDERHDWRLTYPSKNKPAQHPTVPPPKNAPKLKVLQITDTHFDPYYQQGANADCFPEPLCCRATNGQPSSPATTAGKWGDYRKCDSPKILLENAFQHIVDTHKDIDYIIWTGDLVPHDTWNQTKESNLQIIRESNEMANKYFKGIPIYPTVGNHESCPVDTFAPSGAPARRNMSWLYDQLDKDWGRWLPSDTSETIKRGAFYSVLVKPGFRIIAINSNYCSKNNYWLIKNSTDPAGQLAWLIRELDAAETNHEKVHIIGHMPPGQPDCIKVWSKNYYDIINRYEATIMAQFFGHTHFDEFEIFYDSKNLSRSLNVAYISPSLTPWVNVNPAYRIYYVDGDHPNTNRAIVDHETWKMDLVHANHNDEPVWYKAYTATTAYNMTSLMPTEWDNLITRMSKDDNLFDSYHRNYYRDTPVRPKCDSECQKRLLCDLKTGRSADSKTFCQNL
ncbi:sphingomyelin phosphodiesterase-like [Phymastichus coffea]|uniref:sphingomyelin phosphodiesterase-like n=1 Tax=Phymastichus coffea TaxID=108790 RepID=UPI00273B9EAD|nr:sphingomyelin phosphodiesterase-like [Phymastichus coffea]XP_058792162.1 sphingomyelin phosphodiesterase-like [Phymastichus coffea]